MATKAYGQITIVDIGDLGQLSVQIGSNQPLSVIYDPNSTNSYQPDWSTSNLKLEPIIYYGSENFSESTPGISVQWIRQINGTEVTLTNNIDNGELTIKTNEVNTSNKLVTYICKVEYAVPNLNDTILRAESRITFSLIEQPTTLKSIKISGGSVFLYNGDGSSVGATSITLTATAQNTGIKEWQYYKDNTYNTISNSATNTLQITNSSSYFDGDLCTIRAVASDGEGTLYDEHTIVKIRDGSSGTSTISAILTNEDQMIAFPKSGDPDYSSAFTQVYVYEGNTDVTDDADIECTTSGNNIEGSWDSNAHIYTVTKISSNAYVDFTIAYNGITTIKRFSLVKVEAGQDGEDAVVYSLETSTVVVNKDKENNYNPSSVTLKAWSKTGSAGKVAYLGKYRITETIGNADPVTKLLSGSDSSTGIYNIPNNLTKVIIELLPTGSAVNYSGVIYDTQTIVVVSDGDKGDQGDAGIDSISMGLGNYSDQIICDSSGNILSEQVFDIPFYGFKGIAAIAVSATISGTIPAGVTLTPGSGSCQVIVAPGAQLADTIVLTINLTGEGKTLSQKYTLTKNKQGSKGKDAGFLQVWATNGGVFSQNTGSTDTLNAKLYIGGTEISSNVTYQWAKWNGSTYSNIANATSSTLQVTKASIESFSSYRVTVTYDNIEYNAYYAVLDKTDPLQVYMFSSIGDKITNGSGVGVLYAKVMQNGEEIDILQNLKGGSTLPPTGSTGDYFAKANEESKTVTLYKYNGGWTTATYTPSLTYTWTFLDKDGNSTEFNNNSSEVSRFLYVDGTLIDKKIQFMLTVEQQ